MFWKKSKRSAFEAFSDGVKAGYRSGYDDGYKRALDDMRREIRESSTKLRYEVLRNGEVIGIGEENNA